MVKAPMRPVPVVVLGARRGCDVNDVSRLRPDLDGGGIAGVTPPRTGPGQYTPQTFQPASRGTRNTLKSALALSLPSSIATATVWPSTSLPQL